MPYIKKEDRVNLDLYLRSIHPASSGELNFCITRLIQNFLGANPNYTTYNATIGALECAKLELYRRVICEYEDNKITDNGDVYE